MAKIFLLVISLLELCGSSTPEDHFPGGSDFPLVEICVIGEGSGFTCQNILDKIEGHITGDCYWSFGRFNQPGYTMIGPYRSLNFTQDSKIGEYFCWNKTF